MNTATFRENGLLGCALASACAAPDCEAVHVSTFLPQRGRDADAFLAPAVASLEASRDGWGRGLCPEHAEGAR